MAHFIKMKKCCNKIKIKIVNYKIEKYFCIKKISKNIRFRTN